MKTLIAALCLAPSLCLASWSAHDKDGIGYLSLHEARAYGVTFMCRKMQHGWDASYESFQPEAVQFPRTEYSAHLRVYAERDVRLNYYLDGTEADSLASFLVRQENASDGDGVVWAGGLEITGVELEGFKAALAEFSDICRGLD